MASGFSSVCLSLTPFSPSYIFLNIKNNFILEFVLIRTGFEEIPIFSQKLYTCSFSGECKLKRDGFMGGICL